MLIRKGSSGQSVKELQLALKTLGYKPGSSDGVFGEKTEDAVIEFQLGHSLLADGIAGPVTIDMINSRLVSLGKGSFRIDKDSNDLKPLTLPPFVTQKVPADKFADGYSSFVLREDVCQRYLEVRNEVIALGGILTSAGGLRYLSEGGGAARSMASFHYVGRALDLALPSGMQDPVTDPYVIVPDSEGRWVVWCRTKNTNVATRELSAYVHNHTRVSVTDCFFNLTEIFNKHGFKNIAPRKIFFSKNLYVAAEWWHFQDETGLEVGVDTFGQQLLKIYKGIDARKFIYWNDVKDYRFGIEWK